MAGHSSIDIMGALNASLNAITSSKIDLSLPETSPFAEQKARIKANQELTDRDARDIKALAEKLRLQAVAIQQASSGGAGKNIRAPARIRNRI